MNGENKSDDIERPLLPNDSFHTDKTMEDYDYGEKG